MSEPAIEFFIGAVFAIPLVLLALWCLCIPTLDAIEEAIKKVADTRRAMEEAWRDDDAEIH